MTPFIARLSWEYQGLPPGKRSRSKLHRYEHVEEVLVLGARVHNDQNTVYMFARKDGSLGDTVGRCDLRLIRAAPADLDRSSLADAAENDLGPMYR